MQNIFVTEWGEHPIPSNIVLEMYDARPRTLMDRLLMRPHNPAWEVCKAPKNAAFWDYIHEQDVKAGKP